MRYGNSILFKEQTSYLKKGPPGKLNEWLAVPRDGSWQRILVMAQGMGETSATLSDAELHSPAQLLAACELRTFIQRTQPTEA